MKHLFAIFWLAMSLFVGTAHAASPTVGDVRHELITNLQKDGALTAAAASAAEAKYVKGATQEVSTGESTVMKWLSLANFLKVVAVIILLIATHGLIVKMIKGLWHIIASVPIEVYQGTAAVVTLGGLFRPELFYPSQSFYVALFCAFAFPMVLGWFLETHKAFALALAKLFNIGLPISCVISAYAAAYFTILAFAYHSQIFGFFAVVGFAGMTTFGMTYRPGVLTLDFKEPALPLVIVAHSLLIGAYILADRAGVTWLPLFAAGVNYYATIALGVALLCGASPWWRNGAGWHTLMMLAAFGFGCMAFNVLGYPVIGSILIVFFVLWCLEWLAYATFSAHWLVGLFATGLILWFAALFIESSSNHLVFKLAA